MATDEIDNMIAQAVRDIRSDYVASCKRLFLKPRPIPATPARKKKKRNDYV